jgi:hypothetical protein
MRDHIAASSKKILFVNVFHHVVVTCPYCVRWLSLAWLVGLGRSWRAPEDFPTSKQDSLGRTLTILRTHDPTRTTMGPDEEGKALATAEYWDSRYAQSNGEDPTHEWFRSYEALEPFFKENLFATQPAEKVPKIVHLGTGDSV